MEALNYTHIDVYLCDIFVDYL